MKKLILPLLSLTFLASCEDDKPQTPNPVDPGVNRVWVLNEGNFQAGNSSLGVYDLDDESYSSSVFASVNNRQLGDVLLSAINIEDEVYLVVNNSGKIEVLNKDSFESTGTISGLTSPRYALSVSPSEVFVSDLFSDSIAVVNPATKAITRYIDISSTSEEMVLVNGKVFITNTYTSHITVLDLATESVSTIATTFNPTAIGKDKNGKVWVLCGGDAFSSINGALEVIDPATETVTKTIALSAGSYTNKLVFNPAGDSLYYLTDAVYKVSIDVTNEPSTPFIASNNNSFYGMGYSMERNELYVGDAKDFNQKGQVFIYDRNGGLKKSFNCGINPNGFWFDE